jgi:hypothetical protein
LTCPCNQIHKLGGSKINLWKLFKAALALVIVTHAFVHLAVVPGMDSEDGNAIGWSGESWLLSGSLEDDTVWNIGLLITALTIIFYLAATLGLLGVPVLKGVFVYSTAIATSTSLLLFFVIWDGIEPDPMSAIFGPITTAAIMLVLLLRERIQVALSPKMTSGTTRRM